MSLLLVLAIALAFPLTPGSTRPTDPTLSATIQRLFHSTFTSDDDRADIAQAMRIYRKQGFPSITQVGDEAAYEFVVMLASTTVPTDIRRQILSKVREAAARDEVPSDAAIFYAARLHIEKIQHEAEAHPPTNPGLRDEIERMYKTDQAVRQVHGFDARKMEETDKQHSARLWAILKMYGVPTYSMVGPDAAGEFVTMIQHQPPRFRQKVLPELKANVEAGQADPESYALVYDRSQGDLGKKQLYGENLKCTAGGKMHEAPIADEAHVNQRRAELGLIRVELYARIVAELEPQFGAPAPAAR